MVDVKPDLSPASFPYYLGHSIFRFRVHCLFTLPGSTVLIRRGA